MRDITHFSKNLTSLEFFHCLCFVAVFLYSLSLYAVPPEIDQYFKSKPMGYGSFATIWILYFTIATLIVKMLLLLCPICVFRYSFEFLFPLSYSYSFVITVSYWPILKLDYGNFYPEFKNGARMPITTDLCYHLLPLVSLFILKRLSKNHGIKSNHEFDSENILRDENELCDISESGINNNRLRNTSKSDRIGRANMKKSHSKTNDIPEIQNRSKENMFKAKKGWINRIINVSFILLTGLIYQMFTNSVFYKTGSWPYPFMDKLSQIAANLMISGGVFVTAGIYLIIKYFE